MGQARRRGRPQVTTERAAPFYCPYCGEEDLEPYVTEEESHGWYCRSCARAFRVKFLGLGVRS
ncbi:MULTISPECIES: Insertion element protein [Microbispora]|uniref:Insertion element protein n=1 Tax=Microbispora maris TaxID=3144104 RepID=A0ABV0AFH7_9ACTN|nr:MULTISPECIES: Insertion element protein [unclassified Microbispora]